MRVIVAYALVSVALANVIYGLPANGGKNRICTPGEISKLDCNTCSCSLDGTFLECTRMACPEIPAEHLNPDGTLKLPHQTNPLLRGKREIDELSSDGEKKQICAPGERTKVECNTCTCSRDGTGFACTRMMCPKIPVEYLNPDGTLRLPHQTNPLLRSKREIDGQSSDGEKKQICIPGETTKVDCNTCICSRDGTGLACTRKMCPKIPVEHLNPDGTLERPEQTNPLLRGKREIEELSSDGKKKQICAPGERTKVECNTCTCSRDGTGFACTRMMCPKIPVEYLNPDGTLKRPQQTNPLLRGKRDINGKQQICTPGERTKVDCNSCICSRDGTALACTRMECPKVPTEYINPDGSIKLPHEVNPLLRGKRVQRRAVPFNCKPNQPFKQDCNSCVCAPDGRGAFCTIMACLAELDVPTRRPIHSNSLLHTDNKSDQVCIPGVKRVSHCKSCTCNSEGTAEVCIKVDCPGQARERRSIPTSCEPNKRFMDDCNQCICSANGQFAACTMMACTSTNLLNIRHHEHALG